MDRDDMDAASNPQRTDGIRGSSDQDRPDHALWIAALHGAAGRRWLDADPPSLAEARTSMRIIEAVSRLGTSYEPNG